VELKMANNKINEVEIFRGRGAVALVNQAIVKAALTQAGIPCSINGLRLSIPANEEARAARIIQAALRAAKTPAKPPLRARHAGA
jgi:hypothetical protein